MTLNKRMVRETLDTYFNQFSPDHRFEYDTVGCTATVMAQNGKQRIPHKDQVLISEVGI